MPIKSWAFMHEGHAIRAEIYWGFFGWNRKRVYVDHQRKLSLRGRFTALRQLKVELQSPDGASKEIFIRFRPRRLRSEMDCEISTAAARFSRIESAFVDRAWQAPEDDDDRPETPRWRQQAGCLIIFPLLIVLAILYAPLALIGGMIWSWQNRRLGRGLRAAGRSLSWDEIEQRMRSRSTPCTLILQMANLTPLRAWWTEEDVTTTWPLPIPHASVALHPGDNAHPFFDWCQQRYLSEKTGTAFIIQELPDSLLDGWDAWDFFDEHSRVDFLRDRYPFLNVVSTSYTQQKPALLQSFAELISDDLDNSLPRLLAGTTSDEPALRRLCLQTIKLANERAAFAIPQLTEQLYMGHASERYLVAGALSNMGPLGLAILRKAKNSSDPRIARSVVGSLSKADARKNRVGNPPARSVRATKRPTESDAVREKRLRRGAMIQTALTVAVLCGIGAVCWYCGTIWTLTIFAALGVATIGLFIWWQVRAIRLRVRLNKVVSKAKTD